ncbi:MAG: hypothetical protein ACFFD2_18610, partial [Promethearchaeota archaeon]
DNSFISDSINALLNQLNNLKIEKKLLKAKNKLELMQENQKLLIIKDFSNLLKKYRNSLQSNNVLQQKDNLITRIKNLRQIIKKGDSQINSLLKESSKQFSEFQNITKDQIQNWQNELNIISTSLQKIQEQIDENVTIERIYYVIKAFQDYKVAMKYLAKAINMKYSQLKAKLVYLLSNSKLDGHLDPIKDMLTLSSLKQNTDTTQSFLKQIEGEISKALQIDFEKKEIISKVIEDKKRYLLQIRYLLIIHRKVGATLYHRQFGTWEIDTDLISGFLSAIQSFGKEIKSKDVPIRKMAYKEFEILLNQGNFVFVALIVDGKTSKWHEEKLAEFTEVFEQEFEEHLKKWSGELTRFKSSGLMIDRIFELFRVYT